ncbi:MAG: hypothetical protein V1848_00220 [Candidatus Magasanikbacteria bacterium]
MRWEVLVFLACCYQYGLVQVLVKKIGATEGSRTRKLVWQFFFAAIFALTTAMIAGRLELTWSVLVISAIGVLNAFGCYCHWRAYDISMSRTAMLSNLDDLFAIGLAYAVLGELDVLNPMLIAGIAVSFICATIFATMKHSAGGAPSAQHIWWVLGYSSVWGFAFFAMRFFSVKGMHILTFVVAWYVGAWIGALITRFVIMGKKESSIPLTLPQKGKLLFLALMVWTSLMVSYWMRELVPITVIQPIQLVAEMFIPSVIGLIFFGEARNMSRWEIFVIASSLIGIVLVSFGF